MGTTPIAVTTILNGRVAQKSEFVKDRVLVGRSAECDVRLDNVGVSRIHAAITRQGAGYVLEDLKSSNGTQVNGRAIQRADLSNGDVVQIGKFTLHVNFGEAATPSSVHCEDRTIPVPADRRPGTPTLR